MSHYLELLEMDIEHLIFIINVMEKLIQLFLLNQKVEKDLEDLPDYLGIKRIDIKIVKKILHFL